jgi:hypothetical protein
MYGRKGFTTKILKVLDPKKEKRETGGKIDFDDVPASKLLKIGKMLPAKNLEDTAGDAGPKLSSMLKLAMECPESKFSVGIVMKSRNDERVRVDSLIVPKNCIPKVNEIIMSDPEVDMPDENTDWHGHSRRLWWD